MGRVSSFDRYAMGECLALALRGQGSVSPNPMVGAVLAKKGRIVARGWHRKFGGPHAEVTCLDSYRGDPAGTTLYVSLEPCSHFGKTPPCTDRIIRSGISQVVVAMKDPNPLVSGRGIRRLRAAGITVRSGLLAREAGKLNHAFVKNITTGLPYVCMKIAQSVDGCIGGEEAPRWLTSRESRTLVHEWRTMYDALLVGAGTVRQDDPLLNVRLAKGRDPDVVIIDGRATLDPARQVFAYKGGRRVFVAVEESYAADRSARLRQFEKAGAIVLVVKGARGVIPLEPLLRELSRQGIASVLVEGGAGVFTSFRDSGLVDEEQVFVAPIHLGRGVPVYGHPALTAQERRRTLSARRVGKDILYSIHYT
jgi:diaminohydroxyphosphoribosylaminopyrimidine deaminase / 5-amino-6-(5-phosphoribosylamino)uracil reductase